MGNPYFSNIARGHRDMEKEERYASRSNAGQPARPRVRSGTRMLDADGNAMPGEYNGATGQPIGGGTGGPGAPMTQPHDWSGFEQATAQRGNPVGDSSFPRPRLPDGGYVADGGSGATTEGGAQYNPGLNAMMGKIYPGWENMPATQRAAVYHSMPHNDSGGENTGVPAVFNRRGESTNPGTGGAQTITYDPRKDTKFYAGGSTTDGDFRGNVPQRDLPQGASRGVFIDPKYIPKGGSNIGYGTDAPSTAGPGFLADEHGRFTPTPQPTPGTHPARGSDGGQIPSPSYATDSAGYTHVDGLPPLPPESNAGTPPVYQRPNQASPSPGYKTTTDGYTVTPGLPPLPPASNASDGPAGPGLSSAFPTPRSMTLDLDNDRPGRASMFGEGAKEMADSPSDMFAKAIRPNRKARMLDDQYA